MKVFLVHWCTEPVLLQANVFIGPSPLHSPANELLQRLTIQSSIQLACRSVEIVGCYILCQQRAKEILEEGDDRYLKEQAQENWQVTFEGALSSKTTCEAVELDRSTFSRKVLQSLISVTRLSN